MIAAMRRNRIMEEIMANGSAKANELARQFNVSEETIRRDLTQLEESGYVKKNYGGAIAASELQKLMQDISPVQQRRLCHFKEKQLIGKEAAGLLRPGMSVFLDSGSTVWSMLPYMNDIKNLTVISNSIDILKDCAGQESWIVIGLGGQIIAKSMSMVPPGAETQFMSFHVDMAFIGTPGISAKGDCTSANLFEANLKKQVMDSARKPVLLADASKLGVDALFTFARLAQFDTVITNPSIGDDMRALISEAGVHLITA